MIRRRTFLTVVCGLFVVGFPTSFVDAHPRGRVIVGYAPSYSLAAPMAFAFGAAPSGYYSPYGGYWQQGGYYGYGNPRGYGNSRVYGNPRGVYLPANYLGAGGVGAYSMFRDPRTAYFAPYAGYSWSPYPRYSAYRPAIGPIWVAAPRCYGVPVTVSYCGRRCLGVGF